MVDTIFSFLFFSCLGWMLEVCYRSLRDKRFVNPGLFKGPYLILYGTGGLLLLACVPHLHESHFLVKILIYFAATTGLELVSGFLAQHIFHARLWDYSDQRFQYKGHICLKFSIYWIALAFAFEYLLMPPYLEFLGILPPVVKKGMVFLILPVMGVDFFFIVKKRLYAICIKPTEQERQTVEDEFFEIAGPILEHDMVKKLSQYPHHRAKTRLDHVQEVAWLSFLLSRPFSLDHRAIVRGALLHDLFFYDWLREGPRMHGLRHHNIALENAKKITPLTPKEADIIKKHMWPLTIVPPRYKESLLVCLVDTYCSGRDYINRK